MFERDIGSTLNAELKGLLDWDVLRGVERKLHELWPGQELSIVMHDEDGKVACSSVEEVVAELTERGTPLQRVTFRIGDDVLRAYLYLLGGLGERDKITPAMTIFQISGQDQQQVVGTATTLEDALTRGTPRPKRSSREPAPAASLPPPRQAPPPFWPAQTPALIVIGVMAGLILAVLITLGVRLT